MATAPASSSPLCRHEEGPFLLLESTFHAVQDILGGTLVLDLLHCSMLSWLYLRRYGLELVVPADRVEQMPPEGVGLLSLEVPKFPKLNPKPLAQPTSRPRRKRTLGRCPWIPPRCSATAPATGWTPPCGQRLSIRGLQPQLRMP